MKILGVDPGSRCTGWGLVAHDRRGTRLLDQGTIRLPTQRSFEQRLHVLHVEFRQLLEELAPDAAAVEAPFHGVNARAALRLAHARGVLLAALAGAGVAVTEYAPATVKSAVTGNGRAEKSQVQVMVARLLGLAEPPRQADLADALAVALCHSTQVTYRAALEQSAGRRQRTAERAAPSARGSRRTKRRGAPTGPDPR